MPAPITYSEWTTILQQFSNGDDTVLPLMNEGRFVLDAGTAQRFYACAEAAYKSRKTKWLDGFNRSMQLQKIRSEDDFSILLRHAKSNLMPLSRFVAVKGLPEELRKVLSKDLHDFVEEIKKSMRDNVAKLSNSRERMLLQLSSFGLYEVQPEEPSPKTVPATSATSHPSPGIRRIIF